MNADFDQIRSWYVSLEPWELVVLAGFPLAVILLRRWIANGSIALLSAALQRFGVSTPPAFRDGVRPAMSSLIVAIALYATCATLDLGPAIEAVALNVLRTFIIFFIFWLLNQSLQLLIDQGQTFGVSEAYLHGAWTKQILTFTLIILMIVVILKAWGIEVGAALTGLGIAGAAVALAAQDLIQNVIAGFNNASEQRFKPGDWVKVAGKLEGIIEEINLRSTTVRQFDNGLVYVPNAVFANTAMVNFSRREARRIYWTIHLRPGIEAARLEAICTDIRTYLVDSDLFTNEPSGSPFVQLYDIEDARVSVLIYCFAATQSYTGELDARHALILEIKRIIEAAGAEFAPPVTDVNLTGAGPFPASADSADQGVSPQT